jgi:hypothetical protein
MILKEGNVLLAVFIVTVIPYCNYYIISPVLLINCILNDDVCAMLMGLITSVTVILVKFKLVDGIVDGLFKYIITLCDDMLVISMIQLDVANIVLLT